MEADCEASEITEQGEEALKKGEEDGRWKMEDGRWKGGFAAFEVRKTKEEKKPKKKKILFQREVRFIIFFHA